VVTYAGLAANMAHIATDLKIYVPEPVQLTIDAPKNR